MKKNSLLKINAFICGIIVAGFILISVLNCYSGRKVLKRNVEYISALTSEGIYYQIDSIFTKPISVSLTMANDRLLKRFLAEEGERAEDEDFIAIMRDYLLAYKEKYGYDSVFLVSTGTNRYYHFNGIDRVLTPDNPENVWYYEFLESQQEYSLNIDNDEAADNEVTTFINCKIKDADGSVMGIVGVGFRVDSLQGMFREYEDNFGVRAYLIESDGTIEISTDRTGFEKTNLFSEGCYENLRDKILSNYSGGQSFWYSSGKCRGYLVAKFVPNMGWSLIIDNDATALVQKMNNQLMFGLAVIAVVAASVLLIVSGVIRRFNARIVWLTVEEEKRHSLVFQAETEKIYENIYEIDITHNKAASEATEQYFESLGVPRDTPFDKALKIIADKQIKEEYREGYLTLFRPDNVLRSYKEGVDKLRYDFLMTNDGGATYYWMRITTSIFYWDDDKSVRMFVYRQNVDEEKRREKYMLDRMESDSLTGLYNKAATQERITELLSQSPAGLYAFFILDIDNFKRINDTYGHAEGDKAILDFAVKLKKQFRSGDVIGRIGGDEFAVFVPVPSAAWTEAKARELVTALYRSYAEGSPQKARTNISASVGVAVSPEGGTDFETLYKNADIALYRSKARGKNTYTIFEGDEAG